jgi:hypothetical protein
MAKNSQVFYYITSYNPLFGLNRQTGELYIKYDTKYMFSNNITKWLRFEAKSIDNGPKLDFNDYLLENQTKVFKQQQNFDTTMISVRLNARGLNLIKTTINVKELDYLVVVMMMINSEDYNLNLKLSRLNGLNLIKYSLNRLNSSIYELNCELLQNRDDHDNDTMITILKIEICLTSNELCVD